MSLYKYAAVHAHAFSAESHPASIVSYLFSRARISTRAFNRPTFYRDFCSTTGRSTTTSPQDMLVTREIEIGLGDTGNAFVNFDPEISRAFQAGTIL